MFSGARTAAAMRDPKTILKELKKIFK